MDRIVTAIQRMLIVLTNISPNGQNTGNVCHRFCHTGLWLRWGSNHIKSTHKIEKAASETRKRLELYKADSEGVTFIFSYELRTGGKCKGIWLWALHCRPEVTRTWIGLGRVLMGPETAPQIRVSSLQKR